MRAALAAKGIQFQLNYIGEVLGDVAGGMRRGSIYENRLELVVDADLEKLFGWQGAALHANGYLIGGRGLSANYVGNLMTVSNIEALPTVRLYEAWFEQKLADGKIAVRIGQLGADTRIHHEHLCQRCSSTARSAGRTSRPPICRAADRPIRWRPPPSVSSSRRRINGLFCLGLFDGDPAGPGSGNPQAARPQRPRFPRDGSAAADRRRGSIHTI